MSSTGAGITVVDVGFLMPNVCGFQEVQSTFGTDATGSRVETRTFIMVGPEIGGYRFPAHRVAAVDLSNANESLETRMDMILGYTTLRQANWLMDFPAKRWAVTRPPRTQELAGATCDADPVK
ncbi:hypothetical protein IV500_02050 [Paeniglutamicibacter antarcticus]|uniref:Uncharacterized protein n=1 Tax=Arthrobacter terrae TaxID=2935737 RepID=A0A931CRC9_9MICC|nr:hypothetical protein [Arthrobacter terrae]MBG0738218.1 hypothetical protein [Arthrobacter terrae]